MASPLPSRFAALALLGLVCASHPTDVSAGPNANSACGERAVQAELANSPVARLAPKSGYAWQVLGLECTSATQWVAQAQQTLNGLPVHGHVITVRKQPGLFGVQVLGNVYRGPSAPKPAKALDVQRITETVRGHLPDATVQQSQLVYTKVPKIPHLVLAYRCAVQVGAAGKQVLVDAASGDVLTVQESSDSAP